MPQSFLAPELVWGLVPRLVGVLYVIAFASILPQIRALAGRRGLSPIGPRLQAVRRDYPGWRRFLEYPTLLWLDSSDRALRVLPCLGMLCGAIAIYGGPLAPWAHAVAWLVWLSLEPVGLIFPWDTMLQEAGFLVLFLPTAEALPELTAQTLPYPAAAFMFRWLVLRLMLGFGKVKFIGSKRDDALYLRGFFVWMPAPTPLAWFGHHLPAWALRGMLYFMFVAEVVAPVLGLFAGPLRLVSFAILIALMLGIHATGNWGYFNLGYALLCVCLLDTQSSLLDLGREPWVNSLWEWPQLALNAGMLLLFLTSLVYFVAFDSWTTRTWVHWPFDDLTWNRPWLRGLIRYFRALSPLRIINGYGVFPPNAIAPVRNVPVFEGSQDGVTWKPYRYRFMATQPHEANRFIAPHQWRIDTVACYAGGAVFDASFYASLTGEGRPYTAYTRSSWLDRLAQRLLEGEPTLLNMLGDNPFPDAPPKYARVSVVSMTPTRPEVRRASGQWWHTRRLGIIVPARQKEAWIDAACVPEPEVFHPDWVDYKRRSASLQALARAYQGGMDPDRAVLVASDLTPEDVRRFWQELVPGVNAFRGDFSRHLETARELKARFGMEQLIRFERVLERFAWLLRSRTERHHFADAQPKIPLKSNFRYHLFLHELVMDGPEAYRAVLADPALAAERAKSSTDARQLWTLTMLRHDLMMAHVCAFRWTNLGRDAHAIKLPGLFEYYPLLVELTPPGEELCPSIVKLPNGEHEVSELYPPPALMAGQGEVEGLSGVAPTAHRRS